MKKMIESITGSYASSARVVDGTLILSLPDALSPIVWRMDLGDVRSSALEVREQTGGVFVLTLKTPRNDVHDIAPFATKAQAVRALMAVGRALEQGQGQSRPSSSLLASEPVAGRQRGGSGKWVACLAAVIVLVVLAEILSRTAPQTAGFGATPSGTATSMAGGNVEATGVPVSADDYLRQAPKQQ